VTRDGVVVGERVQLGLCTKPNGVHRAEVQKLLVHTGIASTRHRAEAHGCDRGAGLPAQRTLLYLDTEPDKAARDV
jgi:acetyltransferase